MSRIRSLVAIASPLALAAGLVVVCGLAPSASAGADKAALNLADQVTVRYDDGAVDTFTALSWNQGVSNVGSLATGGGAGTGKRQHKPFVITKELDKSSPVLMKACVKGQHIPEVRFDATKKSGGGSHVYLTVTMTDVLVSSFSTSGQGSTGPSDSPVPHEQIEFTFQKITWEYRDLGVVFEDTID